MQPEQQKHWKDGGGGGTAALSSQRYGLQVADSALMSDDTSKHAQYTHNWYSRNTVKQRWLRQPTKSYYRSFVSLGPQMTNL